MTARTPGFFGKGVRALVALGVVSALVIAAGAAWVWQHTARLPAEARAALASPETVTFYSLEPESWIRPVAGRKKFHEVEVLGQVELKGRERGIAARAFADSVAQWDGSMAACFEPRHALRIRHDGRTYDFLLCYGCQQMVVYRDDRPFASVGAAGSAEVLNALIRKHGLPLAYAYSDQARIDREREARARVDRWARWQQATPTSLQPLLAGNAAYEQGAPHALAAIEGPLTRALATQYPDPGARIRALFAWLGSGAGPWSGFPGYESLPEAMLLAYPTPELVAAATAQPLSPREREGAARLFGGWDFSKREPEATDSLPPALKSILLEHVHATPGDDDRLQRAERAFAP